MVVFRLGVLGVVEGRLSGYSSTPMLERLRPVPMKASLSMRGTGGLMGFSFFCLREVVLGSLRPMIGAVVGSVVGSGRGCVDVMSGDE